MDEKMKQNLLALLDRVPIQGLNEINIITEIIAYLNDDKQKSKDVVK